MKTQKTSTEITPSGVSDISCNRDIRCIITPNCNYDCGFCHKERMTGNEKSLFDAKDYGFMYEVANKTIPLQGVTLTGGEPLVRKDIYDILTELKEKDAFVTMVSNGSLLAKNPKVLSLLDRLNLSLHTTNQALYETITNATTNVKHLMHDISGMKKQYPDLDIRVNATLVEGSTARPYEVLTMLDFIKDTGLTIKYLELSPRNSPGFVPSTYILPLLQQKGFEAVGTERGETVYQSGAAKVMLRTLMCSLVEDHNLDQSYCKQNADINISPDGLISPCLLDQKKIGIYELVKSRNDEGLAHAFRSATSEATQYACCVKNKK